MGVRDDIYKAADGYLLPANIVHEAALVAEAREKELLAEKAALIAELQEALCRKEGKDGYAVVPALIIEAILAKYEAQ